jgi:hypothetical protein
VKRSINVIIYGQREIISCRTKVGPGKVTCVVSGMVEYVLAVEMVGEDHLSVAADFID